MKRNKTEKSKPKNFVMCEIDERKAKGVPQEIVHDDIPYRAVFAKTLKEMPTHEESVSALHSFYDRWSQAVDEIYSK